MVREEGFEPSPDGFEGHRSSPLSYSRKNGTPGRTRTYDLLLVRQMLWPLSYWSMVDRLGLEPS